MYHVIDVELTPNPHALKFILNEKLLKFESRQYNSKPEAEHDALARSIFEIEGVVSVFYMDKFVTIEKSKDSDWGKIQRPFVTLLSHFDKTHLPVEKELTVSDVNADAMLQMINTILNTKVRPALAYDGGGLEVLGFEDFTLKVRYQGACGTCPSAINGTLSAIESVLKKEVNPAIQVVTG